MSGGNRERTLSQDNRFDGGWRNRGHRDMKNRELKTQRGTGGTETQREYRRKRIHRKPRYETKRWGI